MWAFWSHVLMLAASIACVYCVYCSQKDWTLSFDKAGLSTCDGDTYISGLTRSAAGGNSDSISRLEGVTCCNLPYQWSWRESRVQQANWWTSFDRADTWNNCPSGYFLAGMYRSDADNYLHNIEEGRCVKPAEHPDYYGSCYNHDISICLDNTGTCNCRDGHYITGLHKQNCNFLHCIDSMRCCTMVEKPEDLDDIRAVKDRIMAKTLKDMAYLAHELGYGWCGGCRTPWIGEGFDKNGDEWQASTVGPCEGYMSGTRLAIEYGDWSWGIKDMKYGEPVIEDLKPDSVDTGTIYNNDPNPVTKTVKRTDESVRTVSHSTTDSWKQSHELGLEFSYSPSAAGGFGMKASYKFNYETSSSTTKSDEKQDKKTFEVSSEKTLAGNTATRYKVLLYKSRTTVPYTATIIVRFSAKFKGFLRWGGGYSGDSTNYHVSHRGSDYRPNVPYKFGDASTPFYTALKNQAKTNASPWMWYDLFSKYGDAKAIVDKLSNEDLYVFKLRGKFEDVIGTKVDIEWDEIKQGKRSSDEPESEGVKHMVHVAKAGPDDPPAPNPPPPVVRLHAVVPLELEPTQVDGN